MDRKALSKRLEGLSSVFASETPIATDLKAMAYTLGNMSESKFKTILSSEYGSDEEIASEENEEEIKDAAKDDSEDADVSGCKTDKSASEDGLYWNVEASDLILASLVKDVTGAELTKEQTPDGEKKAKKPATLKDDQTPSIKESLKSDIVKKSQGAVKKEAAKKDVADVVDDAVDDAVAEGDAEVAKAEAESPVNAGTKKGPGIPDGTGPLKGTPVCDKEAAGAKDQVLETVQPKADSSGDIDPNMGDSVKEQGSLEDQAKKDGEKLSLEKRTASFSEGVELNAPMIDVSLSTKEAANLGKLFA